MQINETCIISFQKLVNLLLRNNDNDEAKLICNTMNEKGPLEGRCIFYDNLGTVLYKKKEYKDALTAYEKAIEYCQDPIYSIDISNIALVKILNKAGQLLSSLQTNTQINRKNKINDSLKKAEDYFSQSISLLPTYADSHTLYGVFLKDQNRISEAVTEFNIAIALDSSEECRETGYAAVQLAR